MDFKKIKIASKPWLNLVITIVSTVLSLLVLAISAAAILAVYNSSYAAAPNFLIWIFIFVGLMSITTFLRNPDKINFIRMLVLLITNIAIGIVVLFAKDNPMLFSLTAGLYCLSIIVSRVFSIIQNHTFRNIFLNAIIVLLITLLVIGISVNPLDSEQSIQFIILLECVIIAIVSFIDAATIAMSQLRFKVLFKIVVSTYSLEILFGLLTLMITFSLILPMFEDNIPTFGDALWYCFAVVTTIGFGDFTCTTVVGRVLTVLLGIYGIVVVAVITSIIVNFYNEVSGKRMKEATQEVKKEIAQEKEKLSHNKKGKKK